jgi:N-acetylated-alpha-linked acidic dipeptidase
MQRRLLLVFLVVGIAAVVGGRVFAQQSEDLILPGPVWTPDARSNVDSLIGWSSGPRVLAERKWEDRFLAMPSAASALDIERHMSSVPHRAGTPADYQTAVYYRDRLKADGFDARFETYQVMFTGPLDQRLELVAPQAKALDLLEGVPGKHSADETTAGPPFEENSGDGDVTAPVFYLNAGTVDDWKAFDALHVTMPPGSIVIEHLASFSRDPRFGVLAYEQLAKHKVAGVIQYFSPKTDGYAKGEVWPKGFWKNEFMAERIGGPSPRYGAVLPPGDPTLPGEAPLPGKKHLDWLKAVPVDFPEMDVTQNVARQILASLDGPVVPDGWHDGFEMVEHVGGSVAKAHMVVKMERKLVTIWNVIGTLRGATKPGEIVVVGGHRDAQVFGAIDPGSGSAVMLQMADAFKKMADDGWRPDRTIQIKSWDGHELGIWGSLSEAYQYGPELRAHVVQYINTDEMTNGPPFHAFMSPELWAFGREIAGVVKAPDGMPIAAASPDPKEPAFAQPSGGSDHVTFIYELGIPSSMVGYYGHFGAHHSAEDNIDGIQTYDPGFLEGVSMAQYTGLQAMRAAGADRMPLRLTDVANQLWTDVENAKHAPHLTDIDLKQLEDRIAGYKSSAAAFDAKLTAAERSGDAAALDPLEVRAMQARDVFWMPDGLYYNKYWHTIDRFQSSLPELYFAAYEPQDRAAHVKFAIDRLIDAINRAITIVS